MIICKAQNGQSIEIFASGNMDTGNNDNPFSQNAYRYFTNICYNSGAPEFKRGSKRDYPHIKRYLLLKNWMYFNNCSEVIVKVTNCPE